MIDLKTIQRRVGVTPDGVWGPKTAAAIWAALGGDVTVQAERALANPAAFFNRARQLTGSLDQVQVDTINALLASAAHWSVAWLAYGLATAWHEARLRPIREKGGDKYLAKYDTGRLAQQLGNTPEADGDGIRYAGRGLVQITGRANYARAGEFLGIDLLAEPDRALEPDVAVRILIWGMETGAFTAKSLATYLPNRLGTLGEFTAARRIINGTDKAALIADHAIKFQDALVAGGWA
ncbi:hypothetical protein GO308_12915 [Sphingomonas sp. SFZ2018-12]|uniref:glycoside hydrolase family 19 protein n=1 Tax=Sphingomonas sp. SFZ2018-12 TaxID=2683197 RepID=UPI001F10BFC2|nr:glycoside hydrolase family 19 protein [Sphingomonas sp. SFZ2018-12]MCH4894017.1 hypothetical protein [Sphingomonas sp. SFZ2018-12]